MKLNLRRLLILLSTVMICILAISGFISWKNIKKLSSHATELSDRDIIASKSAGVLDMYHDGVVRIVFSAIYDNEHNSGKNLKNYISDLDTATMTMEVSFDTIKDLKLSDKIQTDLETISPIMKLYLVEAGNVLKALEKEKVTVQLVHDFEEHFKKLEGPLGSLSDRLQTKARADGQEAVALAESSSKTTVLILIMGLLCGSVLSVIVYRAIVKIENESALSMNEAVRSQNMVEKSPVNIMMANPEGVLTSLNENARISLQKLKEFIPDSLDNLVGKKVEIFNSNKAISNAILGDEKNLPVKSLMDFGHEVLDVLVAAIYDTTGKYIGPMITWEFVTEKVALVKDLTKSAEDLALSAANVLSISSNLSTAAEETSAQANTASVAAEEVNAGVQTVASNMGEMVVAIRNITKTTQEASALTNEAMRITSNTNTLINQLGVSSMDIGNVIKVISSIAQQTNLLALNATIEAARAGDAGKGFAVVANEVKELANQTAIATNEITQKIEAIQADSKNAVSAIAEISSAIEKVNGYNGSIALAVETQATTTNEVTRVVSEAAEGVKQINENISQVSSAAASTGKDAGKSQEAAEAVGRIATELNKYVASLKV